MKIKDHLISYTLISGLFLLLDQVLKYLARTNSDFTFYLWKPILGWEYFANPGIAFSIPIPNWLIILITPIILILFIGLILKSKKKTKIFYFSLFLIIAGAISNFIDRILFSATIDYLRILTGIINLADVMIVVGTGIILWREWKIK